MNGVTMMNGKEKPELSQVKRRLENIFGSYDRFSRMFDADDMDSATALMFSAARHSATAAAAAAAAASADASTSTSVSGKRNGAESTGDGGGTSTASSRTPSPWPPTSFTTNATTTAGRSLTNGHIGEDGAPPQPSSTKGTLVRPAPLSHAKRHHHEHRTGYFPPSAPKASRIEAKNNSNGQLRPPTVDVLQSMQGLVKDELLTTLDCSTNMNCPVKEHYHHNQSLASTSAQAAVSDTNAACTTIRKRKHSANGRGINVETIFRQLGRVSPLLLPLKKLSTPPKYRRYEESNEPPYRQRTAATAKTTAAEQEQPQHRHARGPERIGGDGGATTNAAPQPEDHADVGRPPSVDSWRDYGARRGSSASTASENNRVTSAENAALTTNTLSTLDARLNARAFVPVTRTAAAVATLPHSLATSPDSGDELSTRLSLATRLSPNRCAELRRRWRTTMRHIAPPTYALVGVRAYRNDWPLRDGVQVILYDTPKMFRDAMLDASRFAGMRAVTVQVPDALTGSAGPIVEGLNALANYVKPAAKFILIPPPPRRGVDFDRVIDCMLALRVAHVDTNPTHRGQTLLSVGWMGDRINDTYVRNGHWTLKGIHMVQRFLAGCFKLTWLFAPKFVASCASNNEVNVG